MRIVDFTESMLGIPSPPWVAPLEPSGCIVKWVRGARRSVAAAAGEDVAEMEVRVRAAVHATAPAARQAGWDMVFRSREGG